MPIIAILHLLLTVTCAVHVVKTGRPQYWIFIILMFPGMGALIYAVAELLPDMARSRAARQAAAGAQKLIDPDRDYRAAQRALEVSPTIHNRRVLADACIARGAYAEAIEQYGQCLTGHTADAPDLLVGLANAQFLADDPAGAVASLDRLRATNPDYQSADAHLLYARALEALGRDAEALAEYAALAVYAGGEEPRCRHAQLLQRMGRREEAATLFTQIARVPELAPKHYAVAQREWIDIARRELGR